MDSSSPVSLLPISPRLEKQTFSVRKRQRAVYALFLHCFVCVRYICCIVAVSVVRRAVEEKQRKRGRNAAKNAYKADPRYISCKVTPLGECYHDCGRLIMDAPGL